VAWANYLSPVRARITTAVIAEARRFQLDPLLLLAVIHTESKFVPTAKGTHGELGLMQIKPKTAKWIAARYGFAWRGPKSLFDPASNIKFGAAYLHYLKRRYLAAQKTYLCAYNMGTATVDRAIRRKSRLNAYADRVLFRYRDREFHQQWGSSGSQSGS
jgi:soluble lytic murein transglycosylase